MKDWREIQRESFSTVEAIAQFLELDIKHFIEKPKFPFLLPKRIAEKIVKRTLDDPIARQFLPLKDELIQSQGFVKDPVCDTSFRKGDRIQIGRAHV